MGDVKMAVGQISRLWLTGRAKILLVDYMGWDINELEPVHVLQIRQRDIILLWQSSRAGAK